MIKYALMTIAAMASMATVAVAGPQVGKAAPDFTAKDTNGQAISLSQFAGHKVVLEWTNHDCPFVQKHYSSRNMQTLQKKATSDGTIWLTIISSAPGEQGHVDPATANDLTASRKAAPTHVIIDEKGQIGRLYNAKTTPHMFVIDENRILQYAGAIDSIPSATVSDISRADNYVEKALGSLRAGTAVITKQSQPYGCSVKYKS